jgi:hypothetical protein
MLNSENLRKFLGKMQPGPITDAGELEPLLARCWHEFPGDYGGMRGHKLLSRMEAVFWEPPRLVFEIERHGAVVLGSSRAEVQRWVVDVDNMTAVCESVRHRQLYPMQARLKVEPLAEEIAKLVVAGKKDDRLKWHEDGAVRILIGVILPKDSAVKRTLEGRRKRFWKAFTRRIKECGWEKSSGSVFRPVAPQGKERADTRRQKAS